MRNAKCQSSNVKWLMSNDKGTRARTRITSTNHTNTRVNVKVKSWESLENRKNEL